MIRIETKGYLIVGKVADEWYDSLLIFLLCLESFCCRIMAKGCLHQEKVYPYIVPYFMWSNQISENIINNNNNKCNTFLSLPSFCMWASGPSLPGGPQDPVFHVGLWTQSSMWASGPSLSCWSLDPVFHVGLCTQSSTWASGPSLPFGPQDPVLHVGLRI